MFVAPAAMGGPVKAADAITLEYKPKGRGDINNRDRRERGQFFLRWSWAAAAGPGS
jgi:hypothetical protein